MPDIDTHRWADNLLRIFVGYIFIFFHIKINNFDLLLDVIGYILIYSGCSRFSDFKVFNRIKPILIALILFEIVGLWNFLLGIEYLYVTIFGTVSVYSFISIILSLYMTYLIIDGIEELESASCCNLKSKSLYKTWKFQVLFHVLALAILILRLSANPFFLFLYIISTIAAVITNIGLLILLHQARKNIK